MGAGKTILAAIVGAVVFTVLETLLGMVPGMGEWYASVFPQLTTAAGLTAMTLSAAVTGFFMGLLFALVHPSVPQAGATRGAVYGVLFWLAAGLMWPVMMAAFAPVNILAVQLGSSFVAYVLTGAALGLVYRTPKQKAAAPAEPAATTSPAAPA